MPIFVELRHVLLHSDSLDEKIRAVHRLAVLVTKEGLREILETLKDPDGGMTLHASIVMAKFGKNALKLLKLAISTWGTSGMHPSRRTLLNLREHLLYSLALLGSEGQVVFRQTVSNEDEAVRTSSEDLLSVSNNPLSFPNSIITVDKACVPLGCNLPAEIQMISKPISLGTDSVNPKVLSLITVFCTHQGLFGKGLRGRLTVSHYYDITNEIVSANTVSS